MLENTFSKISDIENRAETWRSCAGRPPLSSKARFHSITLSWQQKERLPNVPNIWKAARCHKEQQADEFCRANTDVLFIQLVSQNPHPAEKNQHVWAGGGTTSRESETGRLLLTLQEDGRGLLQLCFGSGLPPLDWTATEGRWHLSTHLSF